MVNNPLWRPYLSWGYLSWGYVDQPWKNRLEKITGSMKLFLDSHSLRIHGGGKMTNIWESQLDIWKGGGVSLASLHQWSMYCNLKQYLNLGSVFLFRMVKYVWYIRYMSVFGSVAFGTSLALPYPRWLSRVVLLADPLVERVVGENSEDVWSSLFQVWHVNGSWWLRWFTLSRNPHSPENM